MGFHVRTLPDYHCLVSIYLYEILSASLKKPLQVFIPMANDYLPKLGRGMKNVMRVTKELTDQRKSSVAICAM